MVSTVAHLHQHNISHGDIYAHNTMVDPHARVLFGDFGAATDLTMLSDYQRQQMQLIEVRALGCLIEDLLTTCQEQSAEVMHLQHIAQQCMSENIAQRPTLGALADFL